MSSSRMSIRASVGDSGVRVLPEMFKHRVLTLAEETLDSLQKIWDEAGYNEVECHGLLGDILSRLKETCSSELAAEQQILDHAKHEIQAKIDEYGTICVQLGRDCPIDHIAPLGCSDKLAELDRLISVINVDFLKQQTLLNTELSHIKDLVGELEENFPDVSIFSGPEGTPEMSDVRLHLMRDFKNQLIAKKNDRVTEMTKTARDCAIIFTEMALLDETADEHNQLDRFSECDTKVSALQQSGEFLFGVRPQDVQELTQRAEALAAEKERRRAFLHKNGAEIARLWTLLRIPQVERDHFAASFAMNLSLDTMQKGTLELARLQAVRAQSLGRVVCSIREDVALLWEEAGVESAEEREREFPMFFVDLDKLEDSAVDMHEAFFKELRGRVEELRPLLAKIARREGVVQDRLELEDIQSRPERLTARGPNARDERKREEAMSNRVRNLEKYTKELVGLIQAWEEKNGPFNFQGKRYFDRIQDQEIEFMEFRDEKRSNRRKKDGKPAPIGTTPSSELAALAKTSSMRRAAPSMSLAPAGSGSQYNNIPLPATPSASSAAAVAAATAAMPPPPCTPSNTSSGMPRSNIPSGRLQRMGSNTIQAQQSVALNGPSSSAKKPRNAGVQSQYAQSNLQRPGSTRIARPKSTRVTHNASDKMDRSGQMSELTNTAGSAGSASSAGSMDDQQSLCDSRSSSRSNSVCRSRSNSQASNLSHPPESSLPNAHILPSHEAQGTNSVLGPADTDVENTAPESTNAHFEDKDRTSSGSTKSDTTECSSATEVQMGREGAGFGAGGAATAGGALSGSNSINSSRASTATLVREPALLI